MKFNCGCEFEELDWDTIPLNCSATWDMIGGGLTKGVFQTEKSLGRRWCKLLKPTSIEEMADVISLIRPGCLEAPFREDDNGKMLSITETYRRIKNKEIEPEYIHESLEPIFKDTYSVPIYQEQIMEICKDFAGFSLQMADDARKSIGKKLPEKMKEVEAKFIKGAAELGQEEDVAKTIFSWIDKFSGYSFNKSHAVGYALIGYQTAYAKVHFPVEFFKNMLTFSEGKQDSQDEIKQLVHEARLFGVEVSLPRVKDFNSDFEFSEDGKLRFGLSHIKNVGPSAIPTLRASDGCSSEVEFLSTIITPLKKKSNKIKKDVAEALIKSGALDYCIDDRIRTLGRFRMLGALTDREKLNLAQNPEILAKPSIEWLRYLVENKIPRPIDKRIPKIKDRWDVIKKELGGNRKRLAISFEKFHLGMAISGSETDLYFNPKVDTTCRNFLKIKSGTKVTMGVVIEEMRTILDKRERQMCFLKVSDSSYMLDGVVVFSSVFEKCGWILEEGKVLMVSGKKQDTSLLVDSIEHL